MRVLLGSGGIGTDERRKLCMDEMSSAFEGVSEVLFIPYASNDHMSYLEGAKRFTASAPFDLIGIHESEDELDAIKEAGGIYVGGGNSFLLIRELHEKGLIEAVKSRVSDGVPYVGISAGSNVACPTMMTTNDMPVVLPPSFDGFGIVPFQINPHYHPGGILWSEGEEIVRHFGETRARRIAEFHQHNETPVIGLFEGSFLRWDGTLATLIGGSAEIFCVGDPPLRIEHGTMLDGSLSPR
ncbi:MAG: dipeptidase PepE [Euryarchaeota archaeon]|nr:dipeptidase PepE [Euryarchaeota archaeon]|tara:strand:- start:3986 stop:4705 length:720 start_codon:yes stop_codon:yes gene_type:complete